MKEAGMLQSQVKRRKYNFCVYISVIVPVFLPLITYDTFDFSFQTNFCST